MFSTGSSRTVDGQVPADAQAALARAVWTQGEAMSTDATGLIHSDTRWYSMVLDGTERWEPTQMVSSSIQIFSDHLESVVKEKGQQGFKHVPTQPWPCSTCILHLAMLIRGEVASLLGDGSQQPSRPSRMVGSLHHIVSLSVWLHLVSVQKVYLKHLYQIWIKMSSNYTECIWMPECICHETNFNQIWSKSTPQSLRSLRSEAPEYFRLLIRCVRCSSSSVKRWWSLAGLGSDTVNTLRSLKGMLWRTVYICEYLKELYMVL